MMSQLYDVDVRTIPLQKAIAGSVPDEKAVIREIRITAHAHQPRAAREVEQYRLVQDRLFESDFDRVVKRTHGDQRMTLSQAPRGELVLHQTDNGRTRIECRFEGDTIWLTQVQLAELFETSVPNINIHLKAVYEEGELDERATVEPYLIVRSEGDRSVSRQVAPYSYALSADYERGLLFPASRTEAAQ